MLLHVHLCEFQAISVCMGLRAQHQAKVLKQMNVQLVITVHLAQSVRSHVLLGHTTHLPNAKMSPSA